MADARRVLRGRSLRVRVGRLADLVEQHVLACPEFEVDRAEMGRLLARLRQVGVPGSGVPAAFTEEDIEDLESDVERVDAMLRRHAEACR